MAVTNRRRHTHTHTVTMSSERPDGSVKDDWKDGWVKEVGIGGEGVAYGTKKKSTKHCGLCQQRASGGPFSNSVVIGLDMCDYPQPDR